MAYSLAETGKSILVIERGDYVKRSKDNWDTLKVFREGIYWTPEIWLDRNDKPFRPRQMYAVGGSSKFYGANLARFKKEDFGEIQLVDGISPSWPISYEDLEPYYCEAEKLLQVRGIIGEDVHEAPMSSPFPYPPITHEPRIAEIAEELKKEGLHPFHLPAGILMNEEDMLNSPCIRCNTCSGYRCLLDARADAENMCLRPALERGKVKLLTNTLVKKLETDNSGKSVARVVAEREGEEVHISGDVFVLSAGAVNSAVVLLRSRSDKHPEGLANSWGLVGRNFMKQINTGMLAIEPFRKNPTVFQKTIGINDFYLDSSGDKDFPYPLGHIHLMIKVSGELLKALQPLVPMPLLKYIANHSVDWYMVSEDLPLAENRIELTKDGGIKLNYRPTNAEAHKRLIARFAKILRKRGFRVTIARRAPVYGLPHQCGTVKFGYDPTDSVLDVFCKAHDLDNLYVVDAGFFPSSTSGFVGLTVAANALRVADHMKERL